MLPLTKETEPMQPPVGPSSHKTLDRHASRPRTLKSGLILALAALGVVYGDLGTNTLFAIRECFKPKPDGLAPTPDHVLSVLSLVFWCSPWWWCSSICR